jgi:uncharacterized protein (DUF342 family)
MKKRIAIDQLAVGMFVDADVDGVLIEGEVYHYLVPRGAVYDPQRNIKKRVRLSLRSRNQIAHARGQHITSEKQLAALRGVGLTAVFIDTNKGDDLADSPQLPSTPSESDAAGRVGDMVTGADIPAAPQAVAQEDLSPDKVEAVSSPAASSNIDYTYLDGISADVDLSYERLKAAFAQEKLEDVLALQPLTRVVIPGELIAVVASAEGGEEAEDIFGRSTVQHDPQTLLKAGANVDVLGTSYIAEIYGYVCLLDGEISVFSPLWLTPDNMEAHFVHFPQIGFESTLVRAWVDQLLQRGGITHGIQEAAIEDLLLHDPPGKAGVVSCLIACGTHPVPGEDARIEYTFDPEKWAGEPLPDGSLDFRERNAFIAVRQDQLLAEIFPGTKGTPGKDLRGDEVSVKDGGSRGFHAAKNVRVESQDGQPKFFYAAIEGNVKVKGRTVTIREMVQIYGDVDYDLGSIEAGKDVHISGSVRPGFSVRAGGSIAIGGGIESGASINAYEDVIVSQGIVGDTTQIVALGNVQARFVQNSAVMARGDVVINSYLLNARVRAGGQLTVRPGKDKNSGSIISGQVYAATGITARHVGSATTAHTLVGIGTAPDISARLHKTNKTVEFIQANIQRAFRTLGLRGIDGAQLKELLARTPRHQQQPIIHVLRKLKSLMRARDKSLQIRRQLEEQSTRAIANAEIQITGTAFADVHLQIGDEHLILEENLQRPVFFLSEEGIELR